MLTRKKHWDTRAFHDFLMSRAATPFQWGVHDCALFAADGIQAITDVDIAADFRGKYTDEAGAFAAIKSIAGGATVADAAAYCMHKRGIPELQHPLMAQRGDLVVVNESGRLIAGLVHLSGRHIVVAGEDGLKRLPITSIVRAWHV
ncbi:MAG TPA: hypothetical protein VKX41_15070 [Alloacidobacterium sp.]|jgi:hypothetical protein|nr:hypothetical protein [Alloacidobacterium sp.]